MRDIITIYKPVGMTPLQAIIAVKNHLPELKTEKITYAGRLDPLAHGVLLLLIGEATKQREEYMALPKTYEFEVLLGIETDSYDILGYVKNVITKEVGKNVKLIVNTFVNNHIGKQSHSYPPYSSKVVTGKPLFWWAKNNKLNEITIPKREIEIFDFKCIGVDEISLEILELKINKAISLVTGDFRQEKILKRWGKVFSSSENKSAKLTTIKFSISCTSGTYVRELVHQLGKEIGCGAIALNILRTSIGNYELKDSVKL